MQNLWKSQNKSQNVELLRRMPINPEARDAEGGGWQVQIQPQQKRGPKQLSETLSLNKIQNRAGDGAQWPSTTEFNP